MVVRPTIVRLPIVVTTLLIAALAVEAQQTGPAVHTVGFLTPHDHYRDREYSAFIETLRSLGYDQGRNLRLLVRSAAGKSDRLPALAKELVDARVDVIVAINTPGSSAAIQATKQIPIVMAIVGDPVAMGFVSNLARPGGNVTGISNISRELAAKRLALVKELCRQRSGLPLCSIRTILSMRYRWRIRSAPRPSSRSRCDFSP
jgi:putative ABC transport system substrate-binding protein